LLFLWIGARMFKRAWLVVVTRTTPCGRVRPGTRVEVQGRVQGGGLRSPIEQHRCVYWRVVVEARRWERGNDDDDDDSWWDRDNGRYRRYGRGRWRWREIYDDDEHADRFTVVDSTGSVEVALNGAEMEIAGNRRQGGRWTRWFPEDARRRLEGDSLFRGLFSRLTRYERRGVRWREHTLCDGEEVYVFGWVDRHGVIRKRRWLDYFMVSNRSQAGIVLRSILLGLFCFALDGAMVYAAIDRFAPGVRDWFQRLFS
jgi:hypothetical protein